MNNHNDLTVSDQMSFWDQHIPEMRGIGYQPPAAPEPVPGPPPEPDIASMNMQGYASYRAEHGIDSSDFIGVQAWSRSSVRDRAN